MADDGKVRTGTADPKTLADDAAAAADRSDQARRARAGANADAAARRAEIADREAAPVAVARLSEMGANAADAAERLRRSAARFGETCDDAMRITGVAVDMSQILKEEIDSQLDPRERYQFFEAVGQVKPPLTQGEANNAARLIMDLVEKKFAAAKAQKFDGRQALTPEEIKKVVESALSLRSNSKLYHF